MDENTKYLEEKIRLLEIIIKEKDAQIELLRASKENVVYIPYTPIQPQPIYVPPYNPWSPTITWMTTSTDRSSVASSYVTRTDTDTKNIVHTGR